MLTSTYRTICTSVFGLSLDELAQFICMLILHLFHFLIDSIRHWSLTLNTYKIYLVSKCLLQSYIGLSPRRFWLPKKFGEVTKVTVVTFSTYTCWLLGLPFQLVTWTKYHFSSALLWQSQGHSDMNTMETNSNTQSQTCSIIWHEKTQKNGDKKLKSKRIESHWFSSKWIFHLLEWEYNCTKVFSKNISILE